MQGDNSLLSVGLIIMKRLKHLSVYRVLKIILFLFFLPTPSSGGRQVWNTNTQEQAECEARITYRHKPPDYPFQEQRKPPRFLWSTTYWKPSYREASNSFLFFVQSQHEIDSMRLLRHKGFTVQPLPAVRLAFSKRHGWNSPRAPRKLGHRLCLPTAAEGASPQPCASCPCH